VNRLQQRLQFLARALLGLAEAIIGALEECFLCLGQKLVADFGELRRQRLASLG